MYDGYDGAKILKLCGITYTHNRCLIFFNSTFASKLVLVKWKMTTFADNYGTELYLDRILPDSFCHRSI